MLLDRSEANGGKIILITLKYFFQITGILELLALVKHFVNNKILLVFINFVK
jgi:hypothetical protein